MSDRLNKISSRITQPSSQGASQAMLYATGLTREDMDKAQVGIASVWWEGNPCNIHLNDLASRIKDGVQDAGLVGMRFNTVGVSDGISMGTEGMSYSLQSRDLIADSIETVMGGQWYDALITVPGCDKNMPGCLMAMGRVNRPSLMVYAARLNPDMWRIRSSILFRLFRVMGSTLLRKSLTMFDRKSLPKHVLARARAVECTRQTRWPVRSKCLECLSHTALPILRWSPLRWMSVSRQAGQLGDY